MSELELPRGDEKKLEHAQECGKTQAMLLDIAIHRKWSRESCVQDSHKDKLENYVCSICTDVCYPVVETPCGHVFCEPCIKKQLQIKTSCPLDNAPVQLHQLQVSEFTRRDIAQLPVKCPFAEYGCEWKGELAQVEYHVMYKNPLSHNVEAKRTSLLQSWLPRAQQGQERTGSRSKFTGPYCAVVSGKCPHCHECIRRDLLPTHAEQTCKDRPILCECGMRIQKRDLADHKTTCPARLVPCPNGCKTMIKKTELSQHLFDPCPAQLFECPLAEFCASCPLLTKNMLAKHLTEANLAHLTAFQRSLHHLQQQVCDLRLQLRQKSGQDQKSDQQEQKDKDIMPISTGSLVRISPAAMCHKFQPMLDHHHPILDSVPELKSSDGENIPIDQWSCAIVVKSNMQARYQVQLTSAVLFACPLLWFNEIDLVPYSNAKQ